MKASRTVVVTGFGAFGDVCANPSECIVNELQSAGLHDSDASVSFLFCVLAVSVEGCDSLHADEEIQAKMSNDVQ